MLTKLRTSSATRRRSVHLLAKAWVRGVAAVAATIFLGIISILVGLNTWANSVPLVNLVRQYPLASIVAVAALVLVSVVALVIAAGPPPAQEGQEPDLRTARYTPRLVVATVLSTLSTVSLVVVVVLVLSRPSWCPTAICPLSLPLTNPHGTHDTNLEIYFTALQSSWYAMPGDPAQYSLRNLPTTVSAVRLDPQVPSLPYRVVLGVHSLQQGQFGMFIERVAVVIQGLPPMPYPLSVWAAGSALNYHTNPYLVVYSGEPAGTALSAAYVPLPGALVQLAPGEADELDVQVDSHVVADLQFRVQVTYRVTNEEHVHTLTLPQVFEVAFSNASNWHPYEIQGGQFVPAP